MRKSTKYIVIGSTMIVASYILFYATRKATSSRLERKGY